MLKQSLAVAALISFGAASLVVAQQTPNAPPAPIKRVILQKIDVPTTNYESVTGIVEIMPNVNIGRHTHFGVESGYVLEGDLVVPIEGKPPQQLKAGDSYQIPPGAIHDARSGEKATRVIATYVIEKGKPLATPAP